MKYRRTAGWMAPVLLVIAAGIGPAAAAELTAADYLDIQQLYARYNHAIDRNDPDAWADTFTVDGVFADNYRGREALKGFVREWHSSPQFNGPARRHFSADLMITPSAEGATAKVSAIVVDLSTRPMSVAAFVSYSDVLVKTPQGWRFKSRSIALQGPPAAAPAAGR
jgi:bifunctional aromatase (cyclase/dehydratase)